MFVSIDPATGETIERYAVHEGGEVERRLDAAWSARLPWRATSMDERAAFLNALGDLLEQRAEPYGTLISREMGKPLAEAVAEVNKCALTARHYAAEGPDYLQPDKVKTEVTLSQVQFEPLGTVLAVMPWNFPFWQVIRFFVPAVLAGNTAILKHAENVQGCAEAVANVIREAAGGADLLVNLRVDPEAVAGIIADRRVSATTLTGSPRAGRSVAAAAGASGKRAVLELGGSDPFIILADADLDRLLPVAVSSRFGNAGQSCISAKRFIVADSIADRFIEALEGAVADIRLGNPLEPDTNMGPLARQDLREALDGQVRQTIADGARLVAGGKPRDGAGYFYEPTILASVPRGSAAMKEETFGPAAAVIGFATPEEAVDIANDTDYGLGASVWSEDIDAASALADRIEAGAVFVNDLVRSDPRLPFGGIKNSGFGRELGQLGAREFVNAKLKWVA